MKMTTITTCRKKSKKYLTRSCKPSETRTVKSSTFLCHENLSRNRDIAKENNVDNDESDYFVPISGVLLTPMTKPIIAQLLQTIHQTLAVKNKSFGRKSITRFLIHSVLRLFRPFEIKIRPDGHPNRVSVNQVLFSGVERHHRVQSEVLDFRLHRKVAVLCKVLAVATPRQIPKLLRREYQKFWVPGYGHMYDTNE
ncbi:hypothetical protein DAPPUDRAFT_270902 [Daphnia pulex]|uniref:Uncharacterized protein n=1 Tax=Daphnia pulex TaxID=6669 RepID=E9I1H1_DAPPU|nr:hypothetical protein DAPPUDRAFT_270902 [Daphnia pulex]|eukprot:EFX62158.1 hypothetical protein DAPPUDRAFT_270902 [Daphnia pulex]